MSAGLTAMPLSSQQMTQAIYCNGDTAPSFPGGDGDVSDIRKNAAISGTIFGIVMGAVFCLIGGAYSGIVVGIISAILFAISMGVVMRKLTRKFAESRAQIAGNQSVVMDGPANHFRGVESVGGWLFLTTEKLIFKSHSVNIQNHEWTVPLDEISEVSGIKTYGFIPNGLLVTTADGHRERFVVNHPKAWVGKIGEARSRLEK